MPAAVVVPAAVAAGSSLLNAGVQTISGNKQLKAQQEAEAQARAAQKEASDRALKLQYQQMQSEYQQQLAKANAWHNLLGRYGIDLGSVNVPKPPTLEDLMAAGPAAATSAAAPAQHHSSVLPYIGAALLGGGATLGTILAAKSGSSSPHVTGSASAGGPAQSYGSDPTLGDAPGDTGSLSTWRASTPSPVATPPPTGVGYGSADYADDEFQPVVPSVRR